MVRLLDRGDRNMRRMRELCVIVYTKYSQVFKRVRGRRRDLALIGEKSYSRLRVRHPPKLAHVSQRRTTVVNPAWGCSPD
jgi:hypothetical protein